MQSRSSQPSNHESIAIVTRKSPPSSSCRHSDKTWLPLSIRCKRLRWVDGCWIAALLIALLRIDFCHAFQNRISEFQRRSFRSRGHTMTLKDATKSKNHLQQQQPQQQQDMFSPLPNDFSQLQPHPNAQLHLNNNGNNHEHHATLSSDVTTSNAEWQSHHLAPQNPSTTTVVLLHDHLTLTDKLVVTATTLVGILAFSLLVMASGEGAWRYYLSGGVCAATSHAIPTPIDVVKTRKQVDPALRNKNFIEASRDIVQKEGVRALLAGLGPTAWGYLFEGAVKFGVYENLKPSLTRLVATVASWSHLLSFMDSQVVAFILCGAVSGAAAAIAVCPMEALRIRLVAEPTFAPQGWLQGGYKILKYEGVSGLWKGMTPMLYKQVPYTVMKNVSFDYLTKLCYAVIRTGGYTVTSATTFTIPFLSAMIASILSCISSQPGDMLLSLVNAHEGKRRTTDFVQDILKSEQGFRGFFVGTKTRLLHVGMIVTLQLLIYDVVKRLCGIAATGSV